MSSRHLHISFICPRLKPNASYRQVIDVGHWDSSKIINNPGESGDPASPHYKDLAGMWSKGRYFPMLYSRAAVEANTERRITLTP